MFDAGVFVCVCAVMLGHIAVRAFVANMTEKLPQITSPQIHKSEKYTNTDARISFETIRNVGKLETLVGNTSRICIFLLLLPQCLCKESPTNGFTYWGNNSEHKQNI